MFFFGTMERMEQTVFMWIMSINGQCVTDRSHHPFFLVPSEFHELVSSIENSTKSSIYIWNYLTWLLNLERFGKPSGVHTIWGATSDCYITRPITRKQIKSTTSMHALLTKTKCKQSSWASLTLHIASHNLLLYH